MILNVTFESSVGSAPPEFTTAVDSAVNYLQTTFLDNVTVNIQVGFGTVNGGPLGPGALGQSLTYLANYTYQDIKAAFANDAKSPDDASVVASLPSTDPTGGTYWVSTAEAKALNLPPATVPADGYVGFSKTAAFDYDPSDGIAPGHYDFFGTFLHEVTEIMGRQLLVGQTLGGVPHSYEAMDLLRFSAPGVRSFVGQQAAYFSPDNGQTNLGDFNTVAGGDYGDWASSVGPDSFLAFSNSGVTNAVSDDDVRVMDAIGWDLEQIVVTFPNLTATNLVLSLSGLSFTVNNTGSQNAEPSTTGVYLSTDTSITPADMLLATVATPALEQGASDAETASPVLPDTLAQGTYYVGVYTDYNDQIGESSETDNASNAVRVILGNTGNNTLNGTSAADTMFGFGGDDSLNGAAGKDLLVGGAGNDTYSVDSNADVIVENPGEGMDTVRSSVTFTLAAAVENLTLINSSNINGTGNALGNVITGNGGNNAITGLGGGDTLDGGGGLDTLSYAGSSAGVNVSLATGTAGGGDAQGDVFVNFERLTGSSFSDTLEGDGNANTLAGGSGTDMLSYAHASAGVTVNLSITTAQNTGGAGIDIVSQFENLTGSNFADVLTGTTGNNSLSGGGDNDSLDGGGGTGKDTLDGGAGADTMAGGDNSDLYVVDDSNDTIIETATGGIDTVNTTLASYVLGSNLENLTFVGAGGFAGTGNDLANTITGGTDNDTLDGGLNNDRLFGGAGDDQLLGGDANDSLTGGTGADTLTGGLGADRFIFTAIGDFAAGPALDAVLDFSHAETDKLDLSAIDAKTTASGNQAFTFIGTQAFHNVAGELHYVIGGSGITVSGDVNGDGVADFSLDVSGVASIVGVDFVL